LRGLLVAEERQRVAAIDGDLVVGAAHRRLSPPRLGNAPDLLDVFDCERASASAIREGDASRLPGAVLLDAQRARLA
jgi:hypothetical protein